MATSDELLESIQNLAISYDRTPLDDQYADGANFHFQLLEILTKIHNQMVIANGMYQEVNNVSVSIE